MDLETAPEEIQPSSLWGARVADSNPRSGYEEAPLKESILRADTSFGRSFRSETGNLSGERRSKIEGYDLDGWPIIPEDLFGSVACKRTFPE
jgi:hypothetical protein